MKIDIKCLRCGKCCIVRDKTGTGYVDCPYLVRYKDGKTICMIYRHRTGALVGQTEVCVQRRLLPYQIPDCPFNDARFPMHPAYREWIVDEE